MATSRQFNRARMTSATTGTGTLTLGSAVTGFASFAEAGITTGQAVSYLIEEGSDFEIGTGVYTTSGTTLTRATVLLSKISGTAGTTKMTLAGAETVTLVATAQDLEGKIVGRAIQKFTASGTYTPTAGMAYCDIWAYGGGAGGGGAATTTTGFSSGGGGGAGSKAYKLATAADIGASQTVTIGGGGNGGSAGANNGSAGVDTSLGSLCIGKGGSGGTGVTANSGGAGGTGGVAGTGDVAGTGQSGSTGVGAAIQTVGAYTNFGGSTDIGGGGAAPAQTAGINGSGYGSGGSGGNTFSTAQPGGNGAAGIIIIFEYLTRV